MPESKNAVNKKCANALQTSSSNQLLVSVVRNPFEVQVRESSRSHDLPTIQWFPHRSIVKPFLYLSESCAKVLPLCKRSNMNVTDHVPAPIKPGLLLHLSGSARDTERF
jgi:hypothetical protein